MYRGFSLVQELSSPNHHEVLMRRTKQEDFTEADKIVIAAIEQNMSETIH